MTADNWQASPKMMSRYRNSSKTKIEINVQKMSYMSVNIINSVCVCVRAHA